MMGENRYTPGPWHVEQSLARDFWAIWAPRKLIGRFVVSEADAALIAAAPDLLEACKKMFDALAASGAKLNESGIDWPVMQQMLSAAISKARGEKK